MKSFQSKWRLACLIVTAILLVILYYCPHDIFVSENFLYWQNGNPLVSETRSLTLSGKYNRRIFSDDYFKGTLLIDGISDDWKSTDCRIVFDGVFGKNTGSLFILNGSREVPLSTLWTVYCSRDFNEIMFFFPPSLHLTDFAEQSAEYPVTLWSVENTMVLSYPFETRAAAIRTLRSLDNNIFPNSPYSWK